MEGPFVHLRTYQAYSMAEALGAVKRELGADAVILGTRTFRRRGFFWFGGRTIVEVTAAAAADAAAASASGGVRSAGTQSNAPRAVRPAGRAPVAPASADPAGSSGSARPAPDGKAARARAAYGETTGTPAHDPQADRLRTRRLAQAMLEQHERRAPNGAAPSQSSPNTESGADAQGPVGRTTDDGVVGRSATAGGTQPSSAWEAAPSDRSRGVVRGFAVGSTTAAARGDGDQVPAGSGEAGSARLESELASIRSLVGQVLRGQTRGAGPARSLPPQLFDWYVRLIGQEMSEELADRIMAEVRASLSETAINDPDVVREAIRQRIAAFLPACGVGGMKEPPRGRPGHPFTMVLVGPTGVGKTTTVAKLAATFKLRFGQRVGLITCDSYRIAAVEQLRTYAGIIGLELRVVLTPRDMQDAMHAMRDLDVVIVDTAGRSQNDDDRIRELSTMVKAAEPDEVHLVLSGTAGERVLMREAEAFGRIGIDRILLTKLDEAVGFGMLISVVHRLGKSISFFSAGQEVPQHIEAGDPFRLADLLLEEEPVS